MKTTIKSLVIVTAIAMLQSCGFGTTGNTLNGTNASTQQLGTTNATNHSGLGGQTGNLLTTVLGNLLQLPTSQASLQGTWIYRSPKVVFESESILTQIGSSVLSSKIESSLATYLAKIGMTEGKSSFTFNSDNTCTFTLSGRTTYGTYTYDTNTKQLTMTGAFGVAQLTCYATVSATGELDMVFDATKLLDVASKVSSAGSAGKTLSGILANFKGLKLGWAMTK